MAKTVYLSVRSRRWSSSAGLRLGLLAVAQFVVILDGSIVNMALPRMARDLSLAPGTLSWVVNAYALAFGGFLLVGGRASDRVGARSTLLIGLGLFSTASLAAGQATSAEQLIAARSAQGLGAALLAPSTLSLISQLFPDATERTRAVALWGAVSIAGGPAGGVLGGLLAGSFGWRAVFLVTVPLGLVAMPLAVRVIPRSPANRDARFGVGGATLATAGVSTFVLSMLAASGSGPLSSTSLVALGASAILLTAFAVTERRGRSPLIPRKLLGRNFIVVGVLGFTVGLQFLGGPFYLTLELQHLFLYSPLEGGIAFLPWGVVAIVAARGAPRVIARVGQRGSIVLGFSLLAAGLVTFSRVSLTTSYMTTVLPGLVLHGMGTSLVGVTLTVIALGSVSNDTAGVIAGFVSSAQQIGGALGLAVLVAGFALASDVPPEPSAEAISGLRVAYLLAGGLAIGGVIAATTLIPAAGRRLAASAQVGDDCASSHDGRSKDAPG